MHRVELKGKVFLFKSNKSMEFLMHRVELKDFVCERNKVNTSVPNAPCGVESGSIRECYYNQFSRFLMHRVELKESSSPNSPYTSL